MSEFEFSDFSSDDSSSEDVLFQNSENKNKKQNIIKLKRELNLYYSNLFIDSFNLIDLFVKSKNFTYNSFLEQFSVVNYHQIYAKSKKKVKQAHVAPHHYITTTQDALAVASKFLRSHSKEARIGAFYLLYTLYKTQPLKTYLINIKMEPSDYHNTKELVDKCLMEGLLHPAFCFYDLDIKRKIVITAASINPCLEANYPRSIIRKHMGRVADKYFGIEYEERRDFSFSRLQLIEHQIRDELTYMNKLSNLTLGHDAAPGYKAELSSVLLEINYSKTSSIIKNKVKEKCLKKVRYKNTNVIAFPGKNENVLEDMVITVESPPEQPTKKFKTTKKRRKIGSNSNKTSTSTEKTNPSMVKINDLLDSESSGSSNDDYTNTEDIYGDIVWRMLNDEIK